MRGFDGANATLAAPAGGFGRTCQSTWAVARDTVAVAVGERSAVAEGRSLAFEELHAASAKSTNEIKPHTTLRPDLPGRNNVILPVPFSSSLTWECASHLCYCS